MPSWIKVYFIQYFIHPQGFFPKYKTTMFYIQRKIVFFPKFKSNLNLPIQQWKRYNEHKKKKFTLKTHVQYFPFARVWVEKIHLLYCRDYSKISKTDVQNPSIFSPFLIHEYNMFLNIQHLFLVVFCCQNRVTWFIIVLIDHPLSLKIFLNRFSVLKKNKMRQRRDLIFFIINTFRLEVIKKKENYLREEE